MTATMIQISTASTLPFFGLWVAKPPSIGVYGALAVRGTTAVAGAAWARPNKGVEQGSTKSDVYTLRGPRHAPTSGAAEKRVPGSGVRWEYRRPALR